MFGWLFGRKEQETYHHAYGDFKQRVAGSSFYQDAFEGLRRDRVYTARLVPENDNQYDSNAIKVIIQGKLLGYLPREDAAQHRTTLKNDRHVVICRAKIIGGGYKLFGIRIDY